MSEECRSDRRVFLLGLSSTVFATRVATAARSVESVPATNALPTIPIGEHQLTRLIAGWNPIGGYSYLGPTMDRHMKEYFTVDRTVEFLARCEAQGINAHQFDPTDEMVTVLRRRREAGSRMNFICLHSVDSRHGDAPSVVARTSPIALAHHGGVTDRLFREGKAEQVHDYVKRAHDLGVLAGVSTHNPDNLKRMGDEGWENDFFMACFYYVTRYSDHPELLLQKRTVGTAFYVDDPDIMTKVVRQIDKPCLGFKILAAGRAGFDRDGVERAFEYAFSHIKPSDGVIVGMYPVFRDEIRENAELTRKFHHLSGRRIDS